MTITRKPPRQRHAALATVPRGQWSPLGVGRVPGYPKTLEAHAVHKARLLDNAARANAAGLGTRRGVPTGFRGQKVELADLRDQCARDAWTITESLWRNSLTPEERLTPEVSDTDEARSAVALAVCVSITLDPSELTSLRHAAMRTVLTYTMPRPKGGHKVELPDGLAWLNGLVEAVNAAVG